MEYKQYLFGITKQIDNELDRVYSLKNPDNLNTLRSILYAIETPTIRKLHDQIEEGLKEIV